MKYNTKGMASLISIRQRIRTTVEEVFLQYCQDYTQATDLTPIISPFVPLHYNRHVHCRERPVSLLCRETQQRL